MEKNEMIPSGWISQREAVYTQQYHGLVKDNMEEKEMIPGEWVNLSKRGRKDGVSRGAALPAQGKLRPSRLFTQIYILFLYMCFC